MPTSRFAFLPLLVLPLLLFLLVPSPSSAHDDEEIVLENGLRVRLMPNPGSGLIASNVLVGAGAAMEEARFAGSSHFLEHLLFNGTERRTQEELYAEVDRIGAYNNATTQREFTLFLMVAPSENLEAALDIQSDMLLHSTLPAEKFEKERGIILEELSQDLDDPDYRARARLDSTLYGPTSPFAQPVLGTAESIATLPREDVQQYYQRQYTPSNMRVVLMGEFDPDTALALLKERFAGASGAPRPGPTLELGEESRWTTAPLPGDLHHVQITLPAPTLASPDYGPLALLTAILGEGEDSRLHRALDAEPRIETRALGAELVHREGLSLLQLSADLESDADPTEVARRLLGAVATVGAHGVGEAEWRRARTATLGALATQVEQLHYYALVEGDRIWHAPAGFERTFAQRLGAPHAEVQAAARRWLAAPPVRVCVLGPGLEASDESIDPPEHGYRPEAAPPQEASSPAPPTSEVAPVTAEEAPSVTVLPNGVTVLHRAVPTTRSYAMHLMICDRSGREPSGREGIADLLHRLLRNGAGPYDRSALAARLESIGAELKTNDLPWIPYDDYYTTPLYSFVRLGCLDEYWEEATRLLGLMITEPRIDEEAVQTALGQMQGLRARAGRKASSVATRRLQELLYPGHPLSHRVLGDDASLAGVTPEELERFARGYLEPQHLVLSVVGNVPRQELLRRVEEAFALRATQDDGLAGPPPPPLTTETLREEMAVGGEQSAVRMGRVVRLREEDRWALPVAVMIASKQMQQDLRETRSLAYSLSIGTELLGENAILTAAMGTRPENLDQAEAGVLRYLVGGGTMEVTPEEIESAVNRRLGRMRMRRVTRMGQAFQMGRDHVLGGGLDDPVRESRGLRAVTPEDVRRAAARYLSQGPLVTVVAR